MFFELQTDVGEWFPFFGSHFDPITGDVIYEEAVSDAKVQVRSMAPFFEERIAQRKREVEHIYNPKTRSMERITFFKELSVAESKAERDEAWDYSITGIEGFKDAKTGKVIECTRENKLALMKNPVFDRFIARCQQLIASSGVKEAKDLEKNSLPSSSSQSPKQTGG
jgi:hypothetical protein